MALKIGIDVGGTFTDFVVTRDDAEPAIFKSGFLKSDGSRSRLVRTSAEETGWGRGSRHDLGGASATTSRRHPARLPAERPEQSQRTPCGRTRLSRWRAVQRLGEGGAGQLRIHFPDVSAVAGLVFLMACISNSAAIR